MYASRMLWISWWPSQWTIAKGTEWRKWFYLLCIVFPKLMASLPYSLQRPLFQRVSYLQVINYCLEVLGKHSGQEDAVHWLWREAIFLKHSLVASRSSSWVLGTQWLDVVATRWRRKHSKGSKLLDSYGRLEFLSSSASLDFSQHPILT